MLKLEELPLCEVDFLKVSDNTVVYCVRTDKDGNYRCIIKGFCTYQNPPNKKE